jgi:hypothetical protein
LKFLLFSPPALRGTSNPKSHTTFKWLPVSLLIAQFAKKRAANSCELRNRDTGSNVYRSEKKSCHTAATWKIGWRFGRFARSTSSDDTVGSSNHILLSAIAQSRTMRIRPSMTMVPLLATTLVIPVVEAMGQPSSDPRTPHVHVAVLPAPIGHRQPTLDDLPPWLREKEKPGTEANPPQDSEQPRTPKVRPDDGVPRICEPC